jgi:hypothetical protein
MKLYFYRVLPTRLEHLTNNKLINDLAFFE